MSTRVKDIPQLDRVAAPARRPEQAHIGAVHLQVSDIERSVEVWSYPGALFFSAGGYHHHLGTNIWSPAPSARDDEAKLLEWQLVVPERRQINDVAQRLRAGGYVAENASDGVRTSDPWGTQVYVRSEESR